jgi:hypothetical protein
VSKFKDQFGYEREDMEIFEIDAYAESVYGQQVKSDGKIKMRVHPKGACKIPDHCVIHNPSDHHMRDWQLNWRSDTGVMERIDPKTGIGHPDPDDAAFHEATGNAWKSVHGCDGGCIPPYEDKHRS